MLAMVDFKPSDVSLFGSFPPFCATFERTEAEVTAAILVRVLEAKGNVWRPIGWPEVADVLRADLEIAESMGDKAPATQRLIDDIARNPFLRPAPSELVTRGFCRWTDEEQRIVEFTDAGLERLRRHVRPHETP